jgi:hypothetical protein
MIPIRLETAEGKPVDLNQQVPDEVAPFLKGVLYRGRVFFRVLDVKPPTFRAADVFVIKDGKAHA